ncbi:MAG: thioesterase family protein [Bryobacteraceae bacterium]
MLTYETRVRVRYAETDQMGVVYYANYLVWMEVARVEFCRSVGLNYKDMEVADGVFLAVAEARCRYLAPARYDMEVCIQTSLEEAHPRMIRFGYAMREASNGRVLATGNTKHIFCGKDMRPVKLPEKYRALFGIKAVYQSTTEPSSAS